MGIAVCQREGCPKASSCVRFLTKEGEVINFEAICNESNDYIYYWEQTVEEVAPQDGTSDTTTTEEIPNNG